jgi:integrase
LPVRALIMVLWRVGLRISEALALAESDLDPSTGGHSEAARRAARRCR